MKPGALVDKLYALRAQRLEVEQQVKELKKKESALKALILVELPRLGLDAASGKAATASLSPIWVPEIMNAETGWPLLYAYIQKHGTFEMLHKRLSSEPFQERWAAGETVPGVSRIKVINLNLSARKART